MLKVTLGEQPKEEKGKRFPKLMGTPDGYVTYFVEFGKGICFAKPSNGTDTIGEYGEEWNMENFTDYNEPITLQNA